MDVATWLEGLGLARYVQAFRDEAIDAEALPELTEADLEKLGVLLGHRKRLLKAIAALPGATGPQTRTEHVAERRQLTVMFCDLVGSTALAHRLDPEDMREVLRAYQDTVAGAITRFEGVVAKFMGDGVLAYFGFPRAHEDDAERAVRAGLDVLAAVTRLRTPGGESLAARVGVATGLVVVGDLIGEGAAQEQAVVGDTPNLAARLQTLASPGAMVIAPSTRRLIGELFECTDLGTHALKGLAEPVRAWRVFGPGRTPGRFEAREAMAGLTPLVGREEELALLLRCWERARLGEGRVVLLSGEPGIGKSRLVRALREEVSQSEAWTALSYQCSPYHSGTALHPVIEQLQRAAKLRRGDPAETKLAKLEALAAEGATDPPAETVSLLAELLAVPTDQRYPSLELTPQRRKELTLRVLADQLAGLAAKRLVLVVLEDAHWADPTTLELFGLAIDRASSLPVLMVITFRPEFVPPWAGPSHVVALALGRLGHGEAAAMVERVSGGRSLPGEVLDRILAKTDGVPLFVEELTKTVLESGLLEDAGTRYMLKGPLPALAVPDTLRASLLARLDRLAPVREVAQVAACLGREFSHELLAAVAPVPEEQLRHALDSLIGAELVFRLGQASGGAYAFKHALVRDAAYDTLLKSRRQQLHAKIARVLEERFPEVAKGQPEVLARHCAEAGLTEKAVTYWHKAGQLAVRRSAMAEATAHFATALDLLGRLAAGPARSRAELELQLGLGVALISTKGWASAEMGRTYARARELCREIDEGPLLAPTLNGLWIFHHNRAELDSALEVAEELLRRGAGRGDTVAELTAARMAGTSLLFRGDLEPAVRHLERVRATYDRRRHVLPVFVPQDAGVVARNFLAWALQLQGHVDRALDLRLEAETLTREVGQPYNSAFSLHVSCVFHQIRGDRALVEEHSAALVKLASEQGFPHFVGTGTFFCGWAMAVDDRLEEGLAEMRRGLAAKRATGAEIKVPYYLGLLAAAQATIGRPAEAVQLLAEALDRAEATRERWFTAELWRLRGETLSRGDTRNPSEAEGCFRRAIAISREQGAGWWELRAATSLARLWGEDGERQRGRDLLLPIRARLAEGSDIPFLREADAVLTGLGRASLGGDQPTEPKSAAAASAGPSPGSGAGAPAPARPAT